MLSEKEGWDGEEDTWDMQEDKEWEAKGRTGDMESWVRREGETQ